MWGICYWTIGDEHPFEFAASTVKGFRIADGSRRLVAAQICRDARVRIVSVEVPCMCIEETLK